MLAVDTPRGQQAIAAEERVAQRLAVYGGIWTKLDKDHYCDYQCVVDGRIRYIEIKCRDLDTADYPDYMISLSKVDHGYNLARQANGIWSIVVCDTKDGTGQLRVWRVFDRSQQLIDYLVKGSMETQTTVNDQRRKNERTAHFSWDAATKIV